MENWCIAVEGGNVVLMDWAVLFSFCGFTGQIAVFLITKVRAIPFQREEAGSCEAEANKHIFKINRGLACHWERKVVFNSSADQCGVT